MCAIQCEEEIELENRIFGHKKASHSCVLKTTMLLRVVSDDDEEEEGTNKTTF